MSRVVLLPFASLVLVAAIGCRGGSDGPSTPTGPSPTATTRILALSGNLAFGEVQVGGSAERTMRVSNTGTAPLTVSGMTVSGGTASMLPRAGRPASSPPGRRRPCAFSWSPSSGNYSGTVTVNGDQTSGANTLPISLNAAGGSADGTFQGRYVVERCDGTGSIQDLLCSANRGLYPVGAFLPVRLSLSQSGSSVSGRVEFGQVTGNVFGSVSPSGVLSLQGTATSGDLTIVIANWATPIVGNAVTGTVRLDISSRSIFGVAAITARLSEVRR